MGSRKAITKEQIIDVAYEKAQREGLSSLSVRAVAEACGVATGTMYNHIPDIAELRTEVLRRFWREALSGADLDQCAREAGSALDYCRKLTETLAESLRGFRSTWLRDAGAADGRTRQRAAYRTSNSPCAMHLSAMRRFRSALAPSSTWARWPNSCGRRCSWASSATTPRAKRFLRWSSWPSIRFLFYWPVSCRGDRLIRAAGGSCAVASAGALSPPCWSGGFVGTRPPVELVPSQQPQSLHPCQSPPCDNGQRISAHTPSITQGAHGYFFFEQNILRPYGRSR